MTQHLPYHLRQESLHLNVELNTIKTKILTLQQKVQEHQDETHQPIIVSVTPSTPRTVISISSTDNTHSEKTDSINLLDKTELPSKSALVKPTQRMKKIHWKPIKLEQIQDSIWSRIDQQWSDFEPQHFEQQFRATSHCETVKFLTHNRRKQIQQGLASLNMSNGELRDIILCLDETKINSDTLGVLIDIVPTSTEQSQAFQLSQYKEIKYFANEERFFHSLYDIKELRPRLKRWLFKLEFDEKLKKMNHDITAIEKAKLAVCLSRDLRQLMCIVLCFGNYMNFGNVHNQNCYGFDISDLYLLATIKTARPDSMTFPMFLCKFLKQKYPTLLNNIIKQFGIVKKASKINCQTIDDEYFGLLGKVSDFQSTMADYTDTKVGTKNVNDMIIPKMNLFLNHVNNEMWKLKFRVDSYHKCQSHLIKYFAYNRAADEESITIQQIFKDIYGFIEILESAQNKLQQQKMLKVQSAPCHKAIDSNIYTWLFQKQRGEGSDNSGDESVSPLGDDHELVSPPGFNRDRRVSNTESLRLQLDVLELKSHNSELKSPNNSETQTPMIIRHKSVEAKMNKFISQTPDINISHPSPYKNVAKRVRNKTHILKGNNATSTPTSSPSDFMEYNVNKLKKRRRYPNTPLSSKSYTNPYKMIATSINAKYHTNLAQIHE